MPVRMPERLEQADEVLGRHVAGEPLAVLHLRRMAADAAERAVEVAHAGLVRGDVVDEPGAARVVEVRDRRDARRLARDAREHLPHRRRRRHAGGVAERDERDAELGEAPRVGDDDRRVDRALERTAERHRDRPDHPEPPARRRHHLGDVLPLLGARALQVRLRVRLGRGNEQADLVRAVSRAPGRRPPARPRARSRRSPCRTRRRAAAAAAAVREASANCGTTFGFEYDVASIRSKPIAAKRSISASLVSVGDEVGLVLQPVAGEALAEDDVAHRPLRSGRDDRQQSEVPGSPSSLRSPPSPSSRSACSRSFVFCTLPLAVMPIASKSATILR